MIVYASDKASFINDVINNNIEEVILNQFQEKLKRTTTQSEIESLSGLAAMERKDPAQASSLADKLIKNTYRTLLTRGMKSCYVYFVDDETREYFEERLIPE